jgi:tetratricopeptide (TPR) repeat protein
MRRPSQADGSRSATTLDAEIERLRTGVARSADAEAVGELVALLLARGHLATREDRDDTALDDYRAAAELLLAVEPGSCPVTADTARRVWVSLAAAERHRGSLDVALEAARRAVAIEEDLPADEIDLFAGFYSDLKNLTVDLEKAGRPGDRVVAAELALSWSHALCAVDPARFAATVGITGAALAKALGAADRPGDAVDCARETLPVLRSLGLRAIELSVLMPLGAWLRSLGRWEESVGTEREALALVRSRSTWQAAVEIHALRMLARSLAGAGRTHEAQQVLGEALAGMDETKPGVVPLRAEQEAGIRAQVLDDMASLDSPA